MTGSRLDPGRTVDVRPALLPSSPEGFAIFLDVDGTLLDIARTPEAVVVQPGLAHDLSALAARLDGALALVSGRSLAFLRGLFPGLRCAMAGLHGAEIARIDGTDTEPARSPALGAAKAALGEAARAWPGVLVEDKGDAFAAHFRQAPEHASAVEGVMTALAGTLGDSVTLQRGKSVIEIRPSGHDKGTALVALMQRTAFRGRRPLAIGDDITDEAMFAAADAMGGLAVKVGAGETLATLRLASPVDVRAWIRSVLH